MSLLGQKNTKPSFIQIVTGYCILSSCYFVQLTHLQTPNLNTHQATQTNNTQTSSSTANPASHANKCTKINWQNFLESNCDSQSWPY